MTIESKSRNFCIIAHIDHGKSTLADRLIEMTSTVTKRNMKNQLLDTMELERERGITIKLQPVAMEWKEHMLNLIDTPGHIDFSYEVSRSLTAVEGAILLVDATQGIEAQTLANLYMAIEQDLAIIPVINKIDLPAADVEGVKNEIVSILGCLPDEIIAVSAKTGENVEQLLEAVVDRVPPPQSMSEDLQALIFDAQYDEYKGVVIYVRLFNGSIKTGDSIHFLQANMNAEVIEVGVFTPSMKESSSLHAGDIGYIITNIKDIEEARVGDTVALIGSTEKPIKGYQEVSPMVFAGLYPAEGSEYEKLRKAIYKLKLSDASLTFEPDRSDVLGFGFRCGFLGLLHLEIIQERIHREFNIEVTVTAPTVAYHVFMSNGTSYTLTSPSALPDQSSIDHIEQPLARVDLITPKSYMGAIMDYVQKRKGVYSSTEFIDEERVILKYSIPLSSIIIDFYDTVKNISSGYASYTYDVQGYENCDIVRLDILVAEENVPGLASLVPRDEAQATARFIVKKLKDVIPKVQFVIKIQAAIGGSIIASERISALRKDVTAKLYGGDVTRKRKLLEKQKKGKKKMTSSGSVTIPHKAYLALLKRN